MSSIHDTRHSVGSLDWSRSVPKVSHGPYADGFKRWNNSDSRFTSGLPTPPSSRTMSGVALCDRYAGFSSQSSEQGRDVLHASSHAPQQQYRVPSAVANSNTYDFVPPSNGTRPYKFRSRSTRARAAWPNLLPKSPVFSGLRRPARCNMLKTCQWISKLTEACFRMLSQRSDFENG